MAKYSDKITPPGQACKACGKQHARRPRGFLTQLLEREEYRDTSLELSLPVTHLAQTCITPAVGVLPQLREGAIGPNPGAGALERVEQGQPPARCCALREEQRARDGSTARCRGPGHCIHPMGCS